MADNITIKGEISKGEGSNSTGLKGAGVREVTPEAKAFGAYLRELRRSHKFNQTDLAKKIDITSGYYGFFEQGRQLPSRKIIRRLARLLDADYLEMLGKAGIDPKNEDYLFLKGILNEDDHDESNNEDSDLDQGDLEATRDDGADEGDFQSDGTQHAVIAANTYSVPAHRGEASTREAPVRGTEGQQGGITQERLAWAMMCISSDPTYRLSEQFTQGELPGSVKALVIQLYQAQTARQILTADESAALNQMLHG